MTSLLALDRVLLGALKQVLRRCGDEVKCIVISYKALEHSRGNWHI